VGLLAESWQSLDLPEPLIPEFIALADELDRSVQTGVVRRWLDGERTHGFAIEFVALLIRCFNGCLDSRRPREAA
jgi:hypothetical protein